MPPRYDVDGTVGHVDGGLVVNRVCRHWYPGGPSFEGGQGLLRESLVIQVRMQRTAHQSQRSVAAGGRIVAVVGHAEGEVTTLLPPLTPSETVSRRSDGKRSASPRCRSQEH